MSDQTPAANAGEDGRALRLLDEAPFAYIAMVDEVRPYVVPMNFAYETATRRLYLHTGPGRKSHVLAKNPRVCIVEAADARFDQGAAPCSDGFAFRSVMVEGTATLLEDPLDREAALRAIVAKYDPAAADEPFDGDVFVQTLVYAVDVEAISYRELPESLSS